MSDDIDDRVQHAQEQNRHVNVQSDISIGMEGDGDSGALSKSRDMLREHNELASNASEQMLQQDDAMIDDEIRSGNEGVAEDILNNGLGQADEQNQLSSQTEPEPQPEPAPEPQPEQNGGNVQPNNDDGLSQQEAPSSAEEVPQGSVSTSNYIEDNNQANVGQTKSVTPVSEPVAPVPESTPAPAPDTSGRSDYLMRQADRIEQHANISDITANKGDRNMMRQGVLHQMDKRTLVHDTGVAGRLQGDKKTALLSHNNKLAADIRDSARTQSKLTAIYSKTHQNAGEAYRRANKLRQAAQQLKLQHTPNPSNPRVEPKKLEPKKLEPNKDNPQTETPNDDFGPHIPQKLGVPKTFNKPNVPAKPKPNKGKDDKKNEIPWLMKVIPIPWETKNLGFMFGVVSPSEEYIKKHGITTHVNDPNKATRREQFVWDSKSLGPVLMNPLPQEVYDKARAEVAHRKASVDKAKSKDKVVEPKNDNSTAKKRLDALNDRLNDGRRASRQASNDTTYC